MLPPGLRKFGLPAIACVFWAMTAGPAAAQAPPVCSPGITGAVTLTSFERDDEQALIATHAAELKAEFTVATIQEKLAPPAGARVVNDSRKNITFIVPATASVPITVSWLQAADPTNREAADPTDPSTPRCAASRTVTLPVTPARRSHAVKTGGGRQGFSVFAVVPAVKNADLSPLEVSARTTSRARLPSAKAKARSMTVPMREEDKVKYSNKLPGLAGLSLGKRCRFYFVTCGGVFSEVSRLPVDTNALSRGIVRGELRGALFPLARSQPARQAARYGIGVEARPGAVYPGHPRPFGYDVRVHQSGRLLARARVAGRCVQRRRAQGLVVTCRISRRSLQLK